MPQQQQTEAEAFVEEQRRRRREERRAKRFILEPRRPLNRSEKIWDWILIGTLILFALGAVVGLVIFANVHGVHP